MSSGAWCYYKKNCRSFPPTLQRISKYLKRKFNLLCGRKYEKKDRTKKKDGTNERKWRMKCKLRFSLNNEHKNKYGNMQNGMKKMIGWPHEKPVQSVNSHLNFNNRFNSMVIDWHYALARRFCLSASWLLSTSRIFSRFFFSLYISFFGEVHVKWPKNENFDAHRLRARKYVLTWENLILSHHKTKQHNKSKNVDAENLCGFILWCYYHRLCCYLLTFFLKFIS